MTPLNKRERELVTCLLTGATTNQQISERLFLGLATVKFYLYSARQKVGVANRVELALWAERSVVAGFDFHRD